MDVVKERDGPIERESCRGKRAGAWAPTIDYCADTLASTGTHVTRGEAKLRGTARFRSSKCPKRTEKEIHKIDGHDVIRWRDQVLRVVRLGTRGVLHAEFAKDAALCGSDRRRQPPVRSDRRQLVGEAEIVRKGIRGPVVAPN